MTDYLLGHGLDLAALASAAAAAGLVLGQRTRRWARWALGLAALALLASPWLPTGRTVGTILPWADAVGYVVVLAAVWVLGRGCERRATFLGLAAALATVAVLALLVSSGPMQAPRALWPLSLQLLCGGGAGVALGAATRGLLADDTRDAERAGQLVLALESAAWLGSMVVRQVHLGVAWGWDALAMWQLACWLVSALVCQALVLWRPRPLLQRVLLAGLGLLLLAQSALTAALLDALGAVSTWIVG